MCGVVAPVLAQLSQKYPQDIRVIFRHFPLSQHPNSLTMAHGTEAAALQGKFFEMEEAVFAGQQQWATLEGAAVTDWLVAQAQNLGLDTAKFKTDLNSDAVKQRVDKNLQEALSAQLGGTPTVYINGMDYDLQLGYSLEAFSSMIELAKLSERAYKACPGTVIDSAKQYEATLKTDKGDIVIRLFADKAPVTVNSFVFLAREKWFNGVTFHRVLPGFVAQAGDPSGTGMGGPGYEITDENQSAKYDKAGLVGMANSGQPNSNGSQFFITFAPAPNLNGKYTIFGEVIQGMDVAQKLTERDPSQGASIPPGDKINEVIITEK